MVESDCNLSIIWIGNDVTPCFRERIIDSAIPFTVLVWSFVVLSFKFYSYRKSKSHLYTPLKDSLPTTSVYGATSSGTEPTTDEPMVSSPQYVEKDSQWSIFNWARLLAFFQFALYTQTFLKVYYQNYEIDPIVEGSAFNLLLVHGVQSSFWAYCSLLAIINLSLSSESKKFADKICLHLNNLYLVHFLIGLVDLHSFYTNYDIHTISIGYSISFYTTTISLILLIFAVFEERHAPASPVITESGRVLSGETWASLYSQYMFSWVNVMMKLGYKRTINDEDLIELPDENRARNVLTYFRGHRKSTMFLSLLYSFKWPLILQTTFTLVWTFAVFGPALFLNKIIKFIEVPDENEPVLTAFIYVFGLFITSSIQSLALQQALYIGRTLGIRIQSIIIGEVFGKALRRRVTAGNSNSSSEGASSKKDKDDDKKDGKEEDEAGNVNNLLSVDAQKIAELTAYGFYLYSYPIQIVTCIVLLYQLLGNAALWGVLVMLISQPITYKISNRFQDIQNSCMTATDKRLKTMNELLSSIRIVKFFAWENDFRKRLEKAREVELVALKDRLYIFMWMINTWFLIPIAIMVVVFYVYTLDNALSAATAFTALALFSAFRAALEDLPFMMSFILQASVSLKRVEKFLQEEEVQPLVIQSGFANDVHIGFVNNATFSWDNPKSSTNDITPFTPTLKDLNLSFPRNKLSIICGPTGSGKTTLISSLLGETYCLNGSVVLPPRPITNGYGGAVSGIAYVAQSAWLQNCSIRDNILFGLEFDEERYNKVLYMTALTKDLDILEFGDATEIGEKGITLSGGQKQRVAIARAVYSQADTIILDDCLSAVDAHTAKHLYDNCIRGDLMINRTILLVTHYVGLCIGGASYVVSLRDGKVEAEGTPKDVIKTGVLGEELANASQQGKDAKDEEAEEGKVPLVPKTTKATKSGEGSKLVKDEIRAEGGVPLKVYATYFFASGGYPIWITVVAFFCLTEITVLAQDYWIKVWASAYADVSSNNTLADASSSISQFAVTQLGSIVNGVMSLNYISSNYMNNNNNNINGDDYSFNVNELKLNDPHSVDVTYYLSIYFGIGILAAIVCCIRLYVMFNSSLTASRRIHSQLLNRILRAKVRFFDTTPMGRIVNRFSSDLETIDQEVSPQLSFFMFSIASTLMVVIVIVAVTPTFIIPGTFITILFWFIGIYYLKTSRDLKRLNSVSRSPIYVQFNETVNGVSTIRAFGCQQRFINENYNKVDSNNRSFLWMWACNRWLHARVDVLGSFVGFCTGFVIVLARSSIDPGLAGLSLSYALNFTSHILWVVRNYAMNEMNMNAVERVSEYLNIEEEAPAHIDETMPRPSWPERGSIQVNNLEVKYAPENPSVLHDLTFEVNPREKIAIVGRTGSGKSSLALSFFRFMEATNGSITIDGVDIATIGLEDLRSRITIIPQDPVLFSGTIRSNLDPFNQHDDATLWAALKRSHLLNTNKDSDSSSSSNSADITLESIVTENGNNFSQGQRQLIALSRALVRKTALIILDEATSSVDFDTDRRIQNTIRTEFGDSTILTIAHRINTIIDYDRVLVLDQGKMIEYDTPYNLITKEDGHFKSMCENSGEFSELLSAATAKHHE
ncbi:hypothetical protein BJ944DRAFT_241568 [Cunninghamella echinulata]|nr:hypothetical protein BJ944DRAFT_241568 [Cunninghamella echinulata]